MPLLLAPQLTPLPQEQAAVLLQTTPPLLRLDTRWYEFNAGCNLKLAAMASLQTSLLNTMAFVDGQRNSVDALLFLLAKKEKKEQCARCIAQSQRVMAEV